MGLLYFFSPNELERLRTEIAVLVENAIDDTLARKIGLCDSDTPATMPAVPLPICEIGDQLPHTSGVYFLWVGRTVVYVGQSESLRNRVNAGHNQANGIEGVSWLPFHENDLIWAESYYIWKCRPCRNRNGTVVRHRERRPYGEYA